MVPKRKAERPRGRPPKNFDYKPFIVRMPEKLLKKLKDTAHKEERSMNELVVQAIQRSMR